jgi:hypothetical protein
MFEFLILITILFTLFLFYKELYPFVRRFFNYRKEREELTKKYNRIWRARKDMLVKYILFRLNFSIYRCIMIGLCQEEILPKM